MISACGNTNQKYDNLRTQSSGLGTQNSSSFSDINCSDSPNVLGNDGQYSSQYRACKYGAVAGNIALYPADQNSKSVCIFPLRVNGSGQASAIVQNVNAPIETKFVFQCANVDAGGSVISFPGLNYNGVYIVDQENARTLSYCMVYGDVSTCANSAGMSMSYGKF